MAKKKKTSKQSAGKAARQNVLPKGPIGGRGVESKTTLNRKRKKVTEVTPMDRLAAKLKALREEQNLSVAQLAKNTGVSPQTIINIEERSAPRTFPTLQKIASGLGHKLDFRLVKQQ